VAGDELPLENHSKEWDRDIELKCWESWRFFHSYEWSG